jgi:plasmid replication initiation protein
VLDRALEQLPLFRLSDSAGEEGALQYAPAPGLRWRVLPAPGERLPGTFDQDVYVGLLHRWAEAGHPGDGAVTFTLHAFLRALGRKADGRTYEQLRAALARLERTQLESTGAYRTAGAEEPASVASTGRAAGRRAAAADAALVLPLAAGDDATAGGAVPERFTILASVTIERRRPTGDAEQLALFPALALGDPGDARVVLGPSIRANVAAGRTTALSWARYQELGSPVARRLYRLLAALAPERGAVCEAPLERWAEQLPLTQRYPSHLQRVLQPAHEMLRAAGIAREAAVEQRGRAWWVRYELAG